MEFHHSQEKILARILMVIMMMTTATTTTSSSSTSSSSPPDDDVPRIVGGSETSILRFPHQASLQLNHDHVCGGSIISARSILTAAHCVTDPSRPQEYRVRVGSSDHRRGGVVHAVLRILAHEAFNEPTTLNNDIALVLLQRPLVFSASIRPIDLATNEEMASSSSSSSSSSSRSQLLISGWGSTSIEADDIAHRLHFAEVAEQDRGVCASAYEGAGVVTATMFCAGDRRGGRDSCQGDSGGPLVAVARGRMSLYGIVSWGLGCGHADYPGIYTRVPSYEPWIRANMV